MSTSTSARQSTSVAEKRPATHHLLPRLIAAALVLGVAYIHIKDQGGSPELANMFAKLLEYYTKYNNKRVKHDDAVIEEEIEFVIEITSSFMKHLIRLSSDG